MAAHQAASARATSIFTAHTAGQIISVVTVQAADQPAAVALAVVSDALRCSVFPIVDRFNDGPSFYDTSRSHY